MCPKLGHAILYEWFCVQHFPKICGTSVYSNCAVYWFSRQKVTIKPSCVLPCLEHCDTFELLRRTLGLGSTHRVWRV